MTHRSAMIFLLCCPCLLLTVPASGADQPNPAPVDRAPVKLSEAALRIHREALVIDGHNDLPWKFREKSDPFFRRLDIAKSQPTLHTDIPRLRQGGVGAQFWSAYVPAETAKTGTAV